MKNIPIKKLVEYLYLIGCFATLSWLQSIESEGPSLIQGILIALFLSPSLYMVYHRFTTLHVKDTEVERLSSEDGIVVANVISIYGETRPIQYLATVTRTYSDGVYKRQESFTSLNKARIWLTFNFQSESELHEARIEANSK